MPPEPDAAPPVVAGGRVETIKRRRDFLAAARARSAATPAMVVQARRRAPKEGGAGVRIGYTCSKKVGDAPTRNRAKRRLRAAAAQVLPRLGVPGWDYVLIGRAGATNARLFTDLVADLEAALARAHAGGARPGGAR